MISDGFFVADKHNHIISDSLRTIGLIERFGWTQKRPKIIETQVDTQKHFAGNYLCLGAQTNSNYFHWLFESISRLNLMDKLYPSGNYKIIVPPLRAFQQEIFDFLKIPEDRLHIFGGSEESYDTLFFATRGIGNIHSFSLEAVNYLSSLASPYRMTTQPRGRYLISRQRCTSRRITNENTLFDYLQTEHGFERIFCEDLNFTDQVKLFANAEIIIGALGAGLTNTVFAPADATLIELAPEGREGDSTLFWNLAAAKGQGYACIVGYQGKNQSLVAHDRRNFTISLAMLKKIMSQI